MPPTDVSIDAGNAPGPFGIFGHYRNLTIHMSQSLAHVRVLAQDLSGDSATDVTDKIHISGDTMTIPGSLIDQVGTMAATPGDLSDPGLVLAIERRPRKD
jgi:hypothetical protein